MPGSLLSTSSEGVRLTCAADLVDFCVIDIAEVGGAAAVTVAPDARAVTSLTPPSMDAALYRRLLEDALLHRAGTGENSVVEVCSVPPARPGVSVGAVELRLAMQPTATGTSDTNSGGAPHFMLAHTELFAEPEVRSRATRRAAVLGHGTTAGAFFCRLFADQARRLHTTRLALSSALLETRQLRLELEACAVAAARESEEGWLQSAVSVLNEKKRKIRELTAELERVKRTAAAAAAGPVAHRPSAAAAHGVKAEASRAGRRRQRSPAGARARVVEREPADSPPTALRGAFIDGDEEEQEASLPDSAAPAPRALSSATSDTTADDSDSGNERSRPHVAPPTASASSVPLPSAPTAYPSQQQQQQQSTPPPAAAPFSATKWMDDLFGG